MKLFRPDDSKYWWYDFTVRGHRYRASTKETNEHRAQKIATLREAKALEKHDPLPTKKAPKFADFCTEFLTWVETARLEDDTKRYYRNGVRLLMDTTLMSTRLDQVTRDTVEALRFSGSASNGNNALRTLRRMFSKAKEWKLISEKPTFQLFKERGRSLTINDDAEQKLLPVAEQPLRDIIPLMRDTGLRNVKELYTMRVENIDWTRRAFFVPDSKTVDGLRWVPISDRVLEILRARCGNRNEGWVWQSRYKGKHIGEAMVNRQWNRAREKADLPKDLVLYCARHDYGTAVMNKTGNLKLVMQVMGHSDVATAVRYQHPGMELVRAAINDRNNTSENFTAGFTPKIPDGKHQPSVSA